jgi:hypothetical protein
LADRLGVDDAVIAPALNSDMGPAGAEIVRECETLRKRSEHPIRGAPVLIEHMLREFEYGIGWERWDTQRDPRGGESETRGQLDRIRFCPLPTRRAQRVQPQKQRVTGIRTNEKAAQNAEAMMQRPSALRTHRCAEACGGALQPVGRFAKHVA